MKKDKVSSDIIQADISPVSSPLSALTHPSASTYLNYALISNGTCTSCLDTNAENKSLSCHECDRPYHAVCLDDQGGKKEGKDIICPSRFYRSFIKAANKEGVYAIRPGNFVFLCDECKVEKGKIKRFSRIPIRDRYSLLDDRIDAVNKSLLFELKELENMLISPLNNSQDTHQSSSIPDTNEDNPWNDKQRMENLTEEVSVHKDQLGKLISSEKIEKICVENGVSVNKTFHMQKSNTTGMVLNSQLDVDVLTAKLRGAQHNVVKVSTRVPTVHIVGLSKELNVKRINNAAEELKSRILKQNPGISTLFECASTSSDDKLILAVKPLKNSNASFKVSYVIRSILANQGRCSLNISL